MALSGAQEGYNLSQIEDPKRSKSMSNSDWARTIEPIDDMRDQIKVRLGIGLGIGGALVLVGALLTNADPDIGESTKNSSNVLNP